MGLLPPDLDRGRERESAMKSKRDSEIERQKAAQRIREAVDILNEAVELAKTDGLQIIIKGKNEAIIHSNWDFPLTVARASTTEVTTY